MAIPPLRTQLKKIKSGGLSRGLALAKVSMSAGAKMASHAVGNLFAAEEEKSGRYKELLISQMKSLAEELGQLKGSVMKVGQMLSVYGEHFLPPEANAFLKGLQNRSPSLEWPVIEKALRTHISPERLAELDIHPEPLASASLGQVHRARRRSDGEELAVKVQYPGVDQAISSDLKSLRSILSVLKFLPKGEKFDDIFAEIQKMLHQEVDYRRELELTLEYKAHLGVDPRYVIPEVYPEYSSDRVIVTHFEEGFAVDSDEVKALSQERRNRIGWNALDLYFKEIFLWGMVQTDPHLGNYRIRIGNSGEVPVSEQDQLVLLDFGAVQKPSPDFLKAYLDLVRGSHSQNKEQLLSAGEALGLIHPDDTEAMRMHYVELCQLIVEPFREDSEAFDWKGSDLPKRVAAKAGHFVVSLKLRAPPSEILFLDRKIGGLFTFLSVLGAKVKGREVIEKYL